MPRRRWGWALRLLASRLVRGEVAQQVVDEAGGVGAALAVGGEVTGQREVGGAVGRGAQQGGEAFGIACGQAAAFLDGGDRRDELLRSSVGGIGKLAGDRDGPASVDQLEAGGKRDGPFGVTGQGPAECFFGLLVTLERGGEFVTAAA